MAKSTSTSEQQAQTQYPYTPNGQSWDRNSYFATVPSSSPATTDGSLDAAAAAPAQPAVSPGAPFAYDYLPLLLSQQPNIYQAQLLHYNKLISPSRGGGGLQTPPLPPVVSSSTAQAGRSRSSSKVSSKDAISAKNASSGGHGGRSSHNPDKNRAVMTSKEVPHKMSGSHQNGDPSKAPTSRSAPNLSSHIPPHSASVPSTPHQHARKFSFESREPSPNAMNSHSPRSTYSESGMTAPSSLKLGQPRIGGCQYETAQRHQRRRIPYSIGDEPLEKLDLRTVKQTPTEEEEAKLASDMREVYDRLLPTAEVEERRRQLVHKLEVILNEEWPGHDIRVHLFGSSGNFLCSDDSDVDICITTEWKELEQVCMIADLLARKGFEKVVCISGAKVPIVKVWDPALNLACDMNVNNTAALENTRMIRTYVEIDPRVRQLAMMVKYWSRRRIVNDAAFGGTLSSYTWICLIIGFLQLREPPVLPALHQLPFKLQRPNGPSEFADNLKRLKGFGSNNESSVAQLLFQFFRFYAHEFDFDKYVLSVRHGKLLTKEEKQWRYGANNKLCVEEPFTTTRNLGNTADEFSFKGLHLELRRAFDLLSLGKFHEACEQYVFPEPKKEEPLFSRPAPQSRPVLMRSASQTHSGRGGRGNHRGGRHNNGYRGNNSNRRASSSIPTYDPNLMVPAGAMQHDLSWYYHPYYQYMQQDLMTHMWPSQESMRQQLQQLYGQQAAAAAMAQTQSTLNQQRAAGPTSGGPQANDRSRTNSFDNAPTSAPTMRTDAYAAAMYSGMQGFVPQSSNAYLGYAQAPMLNTSSSQDFRRGSQRSSVMTESGNSASSSSLRSQSQPAARSQNLAYGSTGFPLGQSMPGPGLYQSQGVNGMAMPDYVVQDAEPETTPRGNTQFSDGNANLAVPQTSPKPPNGSDTTSANLTPMVNSSISPVDVNAQSSSGRRRRLSSDQHPQTILDRRMRRTSRSPSPMGHTRAISVGAGPTPLSGQPLSAGPTVSSNGPLIVNGSSGARGISNGTQRQQSAPQAESIPVGFNNPLQLNLGPTPAEKGEASVPRAALPPNPVASSATTPVAPQMGPAQMPMADDTSFRERIALLSLQANSSGMGSLDPANGPADGSSGPADGLSPSARQRIASQQNQSGGAIAPLDLAISGENLGQFKAGPDAALLSPVYETRTPSPTVVRNEFVGKNDAKSATTEVKGGQQKTTSAPAKPSPLTQKPANQNGHTRGARSESDSSWQKAGKGKKKGGQGNQQQQQTSGHAEARPTNASERKGG